MMHQLDNLCTLFRENLGEKEKSRCVRSEGKKNVVADVEPINLSLAVAFTVAFGGLGIALYKGFWTRN